MESLIGKVIGNYKILEVVGKGGMGTVFKGIDIALERQVAMKMMDPVLARDESFLRRFKTEAKALARLENPNIVTVYALQESEFGLFIVMEFVDGTTLADMVLERGYLPWQQALPIFDQILSAIGHAHKNDVIHRDIKPANIMLTRQEIVKVTDFGLAKVRQPHDSDSTVTRGSMGTPRYMSPEQVMGAGKVDYRTDIYALGMTFYEILAGRTPFDKTDSEFTIMKAIVEKEFPPPTHFNPDLPKEMSRIIMKAIEKNPTKRFQGIAELHQSIMNLEPEITRKQPARPIPVVLKPKRFRSAMAASLVGLIFVILLIIFVPKLFRQGTKQPGMDKPQPATPVDSLSQPGYQIPRKDVNEDTTGVTLSEATGIHIETYPVSANVYLESTFKGTTPLDIDYIEQGSYNLKITMAGYKDVTQVIEVQQGQIRQVYQNLVEVGTLVLSVRPSGASILVDGKRKRTATIKDLTVGRHQVVVRKDNYLDYNRSIFIRHKEVTRLNVVLDPELGEVSIIVKPYGDIYINNMLKKKETNIQYTTQLQVGKHTVKLTNPRLGVYEKEIDIRANEPQRLDVDFTKTGKITITSSPTWGFIWVDDKDQGKETPRELDLRIGIHTIEVKRPNMTGKKIKVLIEEGDNGRLPFELKEIK